MSFEGQGTERLGGDRPLGDAQITAAVDGDGLGAGMHWKHAATIFGWWRNGADGRSGAPSHRTSDLVQNTFLDAWRGFSGFRGRTPGQLRAWLRTILIHMSLYAQRRPHEHALDPRLCDAAALPAESPSGAAIRKSTSDDLDAALERLSPRHRQAVQLRIWDQQSFAQIGAAMEISEDAARMLFARALGSLRTLLRSRDDAR